jgi:RNA polymerase sigma factor (sigma-70 family)
MLGGNRTLLPARRALLWLRGSRFDRERQCRIERNLSRSTFRAYGASRVRCCAATSRAQTISSKIPSNELWQIGNAAVQPETRVPGFTQFCITAFGANGPASPDEASISTWTRSRAPQLPEIDGGQEAAIMYRDLLRGFAQLTEDQRAVLFLIGVENLSYEEAARVLGVATGTVMSRLSRGREGLRQYLNGDRQLRHPDLRRMK